ncbi:hypothetical protein UlMin_004150 [Ulmus minor]
MRYSKVISTMAVLQVLLLLLLSFHHQLQVLAQATQSYQDFSYMKFVYNATNLPQEEEYDYIVIGGGTAGCPLAATLSEKYSVLVLERGGAPISTPNVLSSSGTFANLMEADDGKTTPAQRFTSEDGVKNVRGRVLGGTSMINGGFFSRAQEEFFSKSGVEWEREEVEKAYEWVEESIVSRSNLTLWSSAFKEALLEAGVGPDNGFSLDHVLGTKQSGSTFDNLGRRHGAVELLNKGEAKNLKVAVYATVERILFSSKASISNPSAIGVIYTDSKGKSHRALVRNKGEVILSAGALGSPQLLLLSGIGPSSYLSSLKIPLIQHQKNVGQFMADNPRNNIFLITPFPLDSSYVQVVGITTDYFIENTLGDLPFSSTPEPFSEFPSFSSSSINLTLANINMKTPGPLSHGDLRLASSSNVKTSPRVRFNYFQDPVDLARCVRGMRKIGEMLETKSMDRFKYTDLQGQKGFLLLGSSLPSNYKTDDSSVEEFCRSTVTTIWHYHGGCLVGKVVDGDFRVMGINKLRVVDGSTFTVSPGTNPQATVMMLGRYVGLKMLQERKESK